MGQAAAKNESALDKQELYYTDMSVGEILRRTRVHYGQSLPDIERALHIRACQIEAIEQGDIENLPGRVYAIGFVRSYAEYLGLDGDKMVHLFKTQVGREARDPSLDFPVAASDSKIPPIWVAGLSFVAAILILSTWWGTQGRDRTMVTEIPAVPEALKVNDLASRNDDVMSGAEETPIDPSDASVMDYLASIETAAGIAALDEIAPDSAPQAAPASASATAIREGILLNIIENSWVEIKNSDGKALVSRVLRAGDQYYVPDSPNLTMSLGNAGGVRLHVDGVPLEFLGEPGQVRRNVSLDAAALKSQYSAAMPAKIIENTAE